MTQEKNNPSNTEKETTGALENQKIKLPRKEDLERHDLFLSIKPNKRLWAYSSLEEIPNGGVMGEKVVLYLNKEIPEGKFYFYVGEAPLSLTKEKDGKIHFEALWIKESNTPFAISRTALKFDYIFTDCGRNTDIKSVHTDTCRKIGQNIKEFHAIVDPIFEENKKKITDAGVKPEVLEFILKKASKGSKVKEITFLAEKITSAMGETGIKGINTIPGIFKDKGYWFIYHFVVILSEAHLVKKSDAEMIYTCLSRGETKFAWFVDGLPGFYGANRGRSEFAYALCEAIPYGNWRAESEGETPRKVKSIEGTLSENPGLQKMLKGMTTKS